MNRRRFLSLASVGVAGGVLTACGNDPEATDLTPTRIADAIDAPTLAANATPPSGENAGGGGAGPEQTKIDVTTVDLKFEPSSFSIPADTDVTVTVTNKGALQHDFHIEQLNLTTKLLSAGDTDTLTFKAPAGTLDFWCTVPGHKEAGMQGTITVGGAGGAQEGASPASEGGAPAATEASIETQDIKFSTKELTIAADTDVKITVTNKGVLQHDFHVDKLDITSKLLNGGESDTVTVKAAAGTYDFWCTVPGHKEAGMQGKLNVVAAGGAAAPAGGEATPASGGSAPAAPASGGAAGATEASIETEDIKFSKTELSIAANTDVKITVTNKGVLQHDFHVDKLDITSKLLNGGDSDTVTVKAAAGTYDFWCTVPGHKEAGMVGKLTVQ